MQSGPRRDEAVLMTEIAPETLSSPYQVIGDWPAAIAGWFVAAVMLVGVGMWGRQRFTADDDAK